MATVGFENIVKRYSEKAVILGGITLDVRDGEFMVLVGPSGCGKSTLLRCLAGLEEITSGTVRIGERVVNDLAPGDRDIAMVFQSYALYPHMSTRENMAFGLSVRKIPRPEIEARVDEAARLLEISHLLDRFPKDLSGGQRQRVAMGRAIVRHPQVFLFDEPLSNLDAALRTQMRVELKRLHERLKATIIYVTHDQVEAMTLADRICVLHRGVIQQVGTPAEVFETPANRFVATFIGTPQMNIAEADSLAKGREVRIAAPGVDLLVEGFAGAGGRKVLFGIRPQDLRIVKNGGSIAGTVEIVEALGRTSLVHVALQGGARIACEAPADAAATLCSGTPVRLSVDPARVHLFDAETGLSIPRTR
ncbi:MAG: sn-glycerol-3-phosphate ABC transporter ATP-binding protein UgpC [Deltaproteobacteria bacterium]|nr:sn-glycerol-3-phosphate ABC transporter ATP-binding protein UgpC [Deltaproteobacteria bacterium]